MSDLAKLAMAIPAVGFVGLALFALHEGWGAAERAVAHIQIRDRRDVPILIRWNAWNVVYFPGLLDQTGLKERRQLIVWQVAFGALVLAAFWYIAWVRDVTA